MTKATYAIDLAPEIKCNTLSLSRNILGPEEFPYLDWIPAYQRLLYCENPL